MSFSSSRGDRPRSCCLGHSSVRIHSEAHRHSQIFFRGSEKHGCRRIFSGFSKHSESSLMMMTRNHVIMAVFRSNLSRKAQSILRYSPASRENERVEGPKNIPSWQQLFPGNWRRDNSLARAFPTDWKSSQRSNITEVTISSLSAQGRSSAQPPIIHYLIVQLEKAYSNQFEPRGFASLASSYIRAVVVCQSSSRIAICK
ncbi:hypothetical protein BJX70DRAFT_186340 [Aspergillus crustosus]